jgi:hypothetical protein
MKSKVLFIAGYSRSGSTLLDCLLGQLPGFFSTGEFAYIWTHGLVENRLCGCGARFLECPFWTEVGAEAFGGWDAVDVDAMLALERSVNRHRFLPVLALPSPPGDYGVRLREYAGVLARLYGAIGTTADARVIVDSTIDPAYGFLLRHVRDLDLRLVHLTRDSRATAFSWTRWQRRTDRVDALVYQRRFRPATTALRWDAYHALVHLLGRLNGGSTFARYEDLVRSPRDEVRRIAEYAGEHVDDGELGFLAGDLADLKPNHTFAGSLMRLNAGQLRVREDDEWKRSLPEADCRVVTALSWPLLRAYGYVAPGGGR